MLPTDPNPRGAWGGGAPHIEGLRGIVPPRGTSGPNGRLLEHKRPVHDAALRSPWAIHPGEVGDSQSNRPGIMPGLGGMAAAHPARDDEATRLHRPAQPG
jgi:hypothetical protein